MGRNQASVSIPKELWKKVQKECKYHSEYYNPTQLCIDGIRQLLVKLREQRLGKKIAVKAR